MNLMEQEIEWLQEIFSLNLEEGHDPSQVSENLFEKGLGGSKAFLEIAKETGDFSTIFLLEFFCIKLRNY
jgi:hypothetical protein